MEKIYIYNKKQALYYINYGVKLLDTGINNKTGKMFWVFFRNETNEAFKSFCACKK